ncbi:hypothetical protein LTR91_000526 [Friedmanniomyces endolithicus]|uniref:Ribosome recycling factor domain-containing protein n=1 Tax=Friedmanniomyces endolithicus TaxID=329885 RepID=A0AAN6L375_9PEZI|nr:hypothetical protein LTS01_010449 [Friedmanniomyces endolithicus]KAK1015501.1 hypothetical protein LTR91_000526 [Friedmanniomyces endolithicus]KAK1048321.1 hypothetical protein LTS16_004505 [Friedmanniomyces endolithicus]
MKRALSQVHEASLPFRASRQHVRIQLHSAHRAPTTPRPSTTTPPHHRLFTTTPRLLKKASKAARDANPPESTTPKGTTPPPTPDDPSDFTTLETEIASALSRLQTDLTTLRAGPRSLPPLLSNLRIAPLKTSPTTTVKLTDLAQVIPKQNRTIHILVNETPHLKQIVTAIQTTPLLNPPLNPQPDPSGQNPLLSVLAIPPPTAETRRLAVGEAGKLGERAGVAIREARARQQRKIRGMGVSKLARPDDLKRAGTGMEKVVERGMGEVKRVVEGVKKGLEGG